MNIDFKTLHSIKQYNVKMYAQVHNITKGQEGFINEVMYLY